MSEARRAWAKVPEGQRGWVQNLLRFECDWQRAHHPRGGWTEALLAAIAVLEEAAGEVGS